MKQELKHGKNIIEIRNDAGKIIRRRVIEHNTEKTKTQEHHAKNADAASIVKKYGYQSSPFHTRQNGYYSDISEVPDLQTALQAVKTAETAFQQLPSEIRKKLGNDPTNLVDYLKDPKNTEEAIKYGLLNAPASAPAPVAVVITNQTNTKASE